MGLFEAVRVGSYWWSNLGLVVISIFLYRQGRQEAYCRSLSWPIMATALAGIAIGVAWQYGLVDYPLWGRGIYGTVLPVWLGGGMAAGGADTHGFGGSGHFEGQAGYMQCRYQLLAYGGR